jgi:hypothetical protein
MTRRPEALAENQEALLRILVRDENVQRINRALAEMGAGEPQIGQFGTAFDTRYGRLELVRKADGIGEYEDWLRNAGEKELEQGLAITVAAPEDILTSKRAAGRAKDLATLDQMRADFGVAGPD